MRSMTVALGLAIGGGLLWSAGCADVTGPGAESTNAAVSDPVERLTPADPDLAYIALPPGTYPDGVLAVIRNSRGGATVSAAITDGGLDAVPIAAAVGDVVEIEVRNAAGGTPIVASYTVPAKRKPRVIRTAPGRGKTDVPLNANIVIVFSEPVSASTLSSSVQLMKGGTAVAGSVHLLEGTTAAAVFEPSSPLEANSAYELAVTQGVHDLQGDALDARVTSDFTTGGDVAQPATVVTVLPDTTAVIIGSEAQLVATARDTNRTLIVGRPVEWISENPSVASVSSAGLVTARAAGSARIRATLDGRSGIGIIVVVSSLRPVASVTIVPETSTVLVGGLVRLTAVLKDAAGNIVSYRPVSWASSDSTIVQVSPGAGGTAVVTRLAQGTASITASSESKSGTATISGGAVGPYALASAGGHTCAVTGASQAWCWGGYDGYAQQLGNGTLLSTHVPSAVAGGMSFRTVTSGSGHSCALTTNGAAYCWGSNWGGALGIGRSPPASGCSPDDPACLTTVPARVVGDFQFSVIAADEHTCALTPAGAAYCWGLNVFGQLGVGSNDGPEYCLTYMTEGNGCSMGPAPVAGGLTFTAIDAGNSHSCALGAGGTAFCWGWDHSGVLGDGFALLQDRASPTRVAGGNVFVAISTGGLHNCALTADGSAYCWGLNDDGQLGVGTATGPQICTHPLNPDRGTTNCSTTPVPVAGDLRFSAIGAGSSHTCGLTTDGAAYCWGDNWYGELGIDNATVQKSPVPVQVGGGLTFTSLSVGDWHNCGITLDHVMYCWGSNNQGQLGNGTTTDSSVPVRVAGQP
jgi:alpha-tubulin suppressor-like RCC1 family protein